jgi:hypothetical protein
MKAEYLKAHPEWTDVELDVKVDHVSIYHTNVSIVVKPKISCIKLMIHIDNDKLDSKIG